MLASAPEPLQLLSFLEISEITLSAEHLNFNRL